MQMHLELRGGIAQSCQSGNNCDFPVLQAEPGAAVDVAKAEFDHQAGKVGRNVLQRSENLFSCLSVNFLEFCESCREARVFLILIQHGHSPLIFR